MASTETIPDRQSGRTLLFRVGGAMHGCDIASVREIVPYRRATRLPGAPPFVQGLINLRGNIVTVLDVGARLAPGRARVSEGSIIVVEHGARTVGLAVDEVRDVRTLVADEGALGAEGSDAVVREVGRVDDTVVIVLDVDALIRQVLLT